MPLITIQPTANQTPDATLGGAAVSGITNTGHGSTVTSSSANNGAFDSDEKSARWFGLSNASSQRLGVNLKLTWTASGSASAIDDGAGGSGEGTCGFTIEYSLNAGSSWNTVVSDAALGQSPGSPGSFTNNNSANISLPVAQNISQVQVRVDYNTSATSSGIGNTGSGSETATISGIQVEVVTITNDAVVLM